MDCVYKAEKMNCHSTGWSLEWIVHISKGTAVRSANKSLLLFLKKKRNGKKQKCSVINSLNWKKRYKEKYKHKRNKNKLIGVEWFFWLHIDGFVCLFFFFFLTFDWYEQ